MPNLRILDYDDGYMSYNTQDFVEYSDNWYPGRPEEPDNCYRENVVLNEFQDRFMSLTEIEDVRNYLLDTDSYNNLIMTKNVAMQLTKIDSQIESNLMALSSIDFGSCERKLREEYNVHGGESLFLFKADIRIIDKKTPYDFYEVYKGGSKVPLNLGVCTDNIIIETPVKLTDETEKIYESSVSENIDMFN